MSNARATGPGATTTLRATLHRWSIGALDLLLPGACALCRQPHAPDRDGIVCQRCITRVVPLPMPWCARCGHPRLSLTIPQPVSAPRDSQSAAEPAPLPPCRWCDRLHPAVRAVRSVCRMDDGSGAAFVHALKYQGWHRVAVAMGRRMARLPWPDDVTLERAAVIPLPLSRQRLRERGYNQAEALARALAPHWRVPVWDDVLVRTRHTQSQVRLTPSERAGNVSRAFAVQHHRQAQLRGQHVVLVDDVVTTAATLNAAAQALLAGGARIISCVTFGRAPDPGDRSAPDYDFTRN
jgi:ComF family protein